MGYQSQLLPWAGGAKSPSLLIAGKAVPVKWKNAVFTEGFENGCGLRLGSPFWCIDVDSEDHTTRYPGIRRWRANSNRCAYINLLPPDCPPFAKELFAGGELRGAGWQAMVGTHKSGVPFEIDWQDGPQVIDPYELFNIQRPEPKQVYYTEANPKLLEAVRDSAYYLEEDDEKIFLECPWSHEHSSGSNGSDTVIFKETGAFHCSHSHTIPQEQVLEHFGIVDRTEELPVIKDCSPYSFDVSLVPRSNDPKKPYPFNHPDVMRAVAVHGPIIYNAFQREFFINGKPLTSSHVLELAHYVSVRTGGLVTHAERERINFMQALTDLYKEDMKTVHPVLDRIEAARWDGKDRLTEIASSFSEPYAYEAFRRFFTAAYRRLRDDEIAYPYILCFQGGSGTGKTSFFESASLGTLTHASLTMFVGDEREKFSLVRSGWIVFLDEASSITKPQLDQLKKFTTQKQVNVRKLYTSEREYLSVRQVVGMATNTPRFMFPESQNRRVVVLKRQVGTKPDWAFFDGVQMYCQIRETMDKKETNLECAKFWRAFESDTGYYTRYEDVREHLKDLETKKNVFKIKELYALYTGSGGKLPYAQFKESLENLTDLLTVRKSVNRSLLVELHNANPSHTVDDTADDF